MTGADRRIGVLVSGRGSNLQALIDAERRGELGGRIAVVLSNVGDAPGLERAQAAGVRALHVPRRGGDRAAYDRELLARLREHDVSWICLAGFMRIVSSVLLDAFPGRILNIHPSLLPSFPGLNAAGQAWDYGVKVSGATVHVVDGGLDTGPIVMQEAVAIDDTHSASEVAARILDVEHRLYPRAVRLMLDGRLRVAGRRVVEVAP